MTPWFRLTTLCVGAALPIVGALLALLKGERAMKWDKRLEPWVASHWFFGAAMTCLFFLYLMSVREGGSYDEFHYMTELRDHGLFHGYNHFLSHFVAWLAYGVVRYFSADTLLMMKVLNCFFGVALCYVVRFTIQDVTANKGLANLGGVLIGVSFGVWKYASSAEVYTIQLLLWAACLSPALRIFEGHDAWARFFWLSFLCNLTVLAHDLSALMGVAFLTAFLLFGGPKRTRYAVRYLLSGMLVFVCLQYLSSRLTGIDTIPGYLQHHLYYHHHPDVQPGDYPYTVAKNIVLLVREGLFSMFTGIDSSWLEYGPAAAMSTVIVHVGAAICFGYLYFIGLRGLWNEVLQRNRKVCIPVALVVLNWLAIYSFLIFYRPIDEFQQWFLPFTVMGLFFSLKTQKEVRPLVSISLLLIAFVIITASGAYNPRVNKLLTAPRRSDLLNDVPEGPNVVFADEENLRMAFRYYRPRVTVSADLNFLSEAVRQGKSVFFQTLQSSYRNYFLKEGFQVTPWERNPEFTRVSP